MPGLYVKLDAEYASDDKLIEAGPLAELLYIRSLAFAKRSMKDGAIKRSQLASVGINIPNVAKQAQALVDVGAWTVTASGWQITTWLKRNKAAATILAEENARKAQSQQANHDRWHVKENKPSATCPLCDPDWETKYSPTGSPTGSESGSPSTKAEEETEAKAEEESKEESETSSSSSSVKLTVVRGATLDDDDTQFNNAIEIVIAAKTEGKYPNDPTAFMTTVRQNTPREHGRTIRAALDRGATAVEAAGEVVGQVQARVVARKIGKAS